MECAVQKSETKRKRTTDFTEISRKQGGWRERDTEMDKQRRTTLLDEDYDDNTGYEVEPSRCSHWDDDTVSKANIEVVDPETGLTDAERDQRSVCVSGISLRATRKEVDKFFSSVCKVRNIELIWDQSSRVPKAMGYIEFDDPIYVPMAIDLSGRLLRGLPIEVKPLNVGNPSAGERSYIHTNHTGKKNFLNKPRYLMTSDERIDASTNWRELTDVENRRFFYNMVTGDRRWELPQELEVARNQAREAAQRSQVRNPVSTHHVPFSPLVTAPSNCQQVKKEMNLVSYSESETQQCEEVEGARLLCCRGVVVNDGLEQAEHHVLNLTGDGSFYGRWRLSRRDCHRRHVAPVIPRLTMARYPGSTSFAALGTTICCVGGDSTDLFLFDAAQHDQSWRRGPSMLEHRVCPRVVAIGNNLFVFGGCSATSRRASWAEVYDTSTNEWTHLPPLPPHLTPPTGIGRKSFFAVAITVGGDESKQIAVGGWGQMFCTYQLSTQTWSCPHFDPGLVSYFTPDSVAIGSTLYSFSRSESCFLAYDFDSQTMFGGALRGRGAQKWLDTWTSSRCDGLLLLPEDDGDDGSAHLLLYWSVETLGFLPSSSRDPTSPATRTHIYCTRVQVSKVKVTGSQNIQSGYLDASVVSSWSFKIGHSFQLQDALFIFFYNMVTGDRRWELPQDSLSKLSKVIRLNFLLFFAYIDSHADGNTVSKVNKEVVDPEADAKSDQKTVYVSGIPLRASREEVNIFFSSVCKARNIDLILDPSLRVPKAAGCIEFYDPIYVSMAVDLSGQLLLGQPIEVKPLNVGNRAAEESYIHTGKKNFLDKPWDMMSSDELQDHINDEPISICWATQPIPRTRAVAASKLICPAEVLREETNA
ncbi:hypothetical protein RHGRI_009730 [Rhododendron griersonianum]|uniref:Uncharacterized protein n=1 Tax=Rhododendron griersonianum TaxID=479676 RepID=A0AAV6KGK5_9ERIC|nr:hypothetical protein RHGRI_009730 [Rhododendron griersonianum]